MMQLSEHCDLPRQLEAYLGGGINQVRGWLDTYSAEFIASLSLLQCREMQMGAVGEIGVHQGKLFVVLLLAKRHEEHAFCIDPLVNDAINLRENSPRSIEILEAVLNRWAAPAPRPTILQRPSTEVEPVEVLNKCGPVRLLSIDGAHDEGTVLHDLQWSEQVTAPYGVVVVDDVFNENWPGVSAATSRHLLDERSELRPFAISPGKLYITRTAYAAMYRKDLRRIHNSKFVRSELMFGQPVDVFTESSR